MNETKKAILEVDLPNSCSCCLLSFMYTDCNDNDRIGCGYIQNSVDEFTDCRHPHCPLKTHEFEYGGYKDHIRIGHSGDALQVIDQVLTEKKFDPESVRAILEAIKDAITKGILQ